MTCKEVIGGKLSATSLLDTLRIDALIPNALACASTASGLSVEWSARASCPGRPRTTACR